MSEGDLAGHLHHLHGGHRCSLLIQDCHLQVSLTPPSLLQRCGPTLSLLKTDLGIRAVISLIPMSLTDSCFLSSSLKTRLTVTSEDSLLRFQFLHDSK